MDRDVPTVFGRFVDRGSNSVLSPDPNIQSIHWAAGRSGSVATAFPIVGGGGVVVGGGG